MLSPSRRRRAGQRGPCKASDDASAAVVPHVLASHPIVPVGHFSELIADPTANGPIGGLGHPSVKSQIIFVALVVVTLIVVIKLTIPYA